MENNVLFEKSKLVAEIQDLLNSWLNEKPETRSVASLSRSTTVADSSIRRFLNNGIKIQDESLFKLVSHVAGTETFEGVSNILSEKAEAKKWFQKHFAYLEKIPNMQGYKFSENQADIVLNPIAFSVFALVSSVADIDGDFIRNQFGIRGEHELEDLIEKGIIGTDGSKLSVIGGNKLKLDQQETTKLLPEITRTYLKANSRHNGRALEIESVSEAGYGELLELFGKFLNDVHGIYKAKPGNIPVVVAGFVDTFTTQTIFEGGSNETPN